MDITRRLKSVAEELQHAMIIADQLDYLGRNAQRVPEGSEAQKAGGHCGSTWTNRGDQRLTERYVEVQRGSTLGHLLWRSKFARSSPRSKNTSTIWRLLWESMYPGCLKTVLETRRDGHRLFAAEEKGMLVSGRFTMRSRPRACMDHRWPTFSSSKSRTRNA